jgi:mannose-6-phosphate isomerase-like protein (cupin superfamily)
MHGTHNLPESRSGPIRELAATSGEEPSVTYGRARIEETNMTTTSEIPPGRRIDLTCEVIGFDRADRRARLVDQVAGRPPQRIDGFTIGAPRIAGDPPHDGEMHPDGDELLYLVSGAVTVTLELSDGNTEVDLGAGDAIVVPQGVWHQITSREPAQLIHLTPGPNGDARPLRSATKP